MSDWINFNGSLIDGGTPIVTASSRALRYGDGLFETMLSSDRQIRLKDLHFDRLFRGMSALQIKLSVHVDRTFLEKEVLKTIERNGITGRARVRLMIFRGEGGLYEPDGPGSGFVIQCWPLPDEMELNANGLVIGIYDEAVKSCDALANIKSNNYLVYAMAALHSKANHWNDCLVLNNHGRICDATIANVFWIKDEKVYTPPLTEGCVAGVMRRHLLERLPAAGFKAEELQLTRNVLEDADEIFLSNAITGIRWVKEFNGKYFSGDRSARIFRRTF